MHSIKFSHEFEFTLEELVEGREARYHFPEMWPEIKDNEVISEEFEGPVKVTRRRIILENSMSRNKIFKDAEYVFQEKVRNHTEADLYEIEAIVESHSALLDFNEFSRYTRTGPGGNHTLRVIELSVKIKVPLVGSMVEKIISSEFKKISDQDRDLIIEYLDKKRSKTL